ncbi:alpha/beta fold hydrolase [Pseudomonas aeruginosa]|uniref:alpha/beta fold hydrolase n=1 Tax=Pseudomonas TaxID=286 RepID=UPI0015520122|nr:MULTISPECIES: alpha/beta hydrolase [Pseudomonas]MCK2119956.1 alpha/beta hydrolase [Pseudomonas sp. PNPG3]QKF01643.1 alpha/beta hydrolase [Pseudomonas aeruginosa]HCF1525207.1 alpha/beta hydrolase [Pseudomonas aeruginosa]HEP8861202.1 alpha/beta hydrolase [Pseudomonas aeruginosa]
MALTDEHIVNVPGLASRWVQLSTGARAHYSTAGDHGPNVILLHGGILGGSGAAGWRLLAPYLAANGFRVFCPDLPGFGLTRDPFDRYTYGWGGFVDFIHDFANALCLDKFHIGGNSMGCNNTANYLISHPERVKSFFLIAGRIGDIVPGAITKATDNRAAELWSDPNAGFDGTEESMRKMMSRIIADPTKIDPDVVAMRTYSANLQAETYAKVAPWIWQSLNGDIEDPNQAVQMTTKGRLDKLDIPGIYLFGAADPNESVEVAHLQEDVLPNVQFFYVPGAGHQVQTDKPEIVNRVVLEFFRDGVVSAEAAKIAGVSNRRAVLPVAVPRSA